MLVDGNQNHSLGIEILPTTFVDGMQLDLSILNVTKTSKPTNCRQLHVSLFNI